MPALHLDPTAHCGSGEHQGAKIAHQRRTAAVAENCLHFVQAPLPLDVIGCRWVRWMLTLHLDPTAHCGTREHQGAKISHRSSITLKEADIITRTPSRHHTDTITITPKESGCIGGYNISTCPVKVLTAQPNSMLDSLFSGRFRIDTQADGSIFLDRHHPSPIWWFCCGLCMCLLLAQLLWILFAGTRSTSHG